MTGDRPPHPGTVEFVDGADGRVIERVPAADMHPEAAYARDEDGGWEPVTVVVITEIGDRRELRQYGVSGRLLTTTQQVRRPS
jgi:hypothetical protein